MKINCIRQDLSAALNIVSKAVSTRSTIEAMKGIYIEATENQILLFSSDSNISIEYKMTGAILEPGSVVLPAKLFTDIVRSVPESEITIDSDESYRTKIHSMNSDFTIIGMNPDDFPSFNLPSENATKINLPALLLKRMIQQTAFSASTEESRGIITGVYIQLSNMNLTLVALDGYRMAIAHQPVATTDEHSMVIDAAQLQDLEKIIGDINGLDDDSQVSIVLEDKFAMFQFPDTMIDIKLLNGNFVDYKTIMPKNNPITVNVRRTDLLQAIERASLLARSDKNKLIKMTIKDTILNIESQAEQGRLKEDVIAQKEGDDLEIGFNAQYLIDMLKAVSDEELTLSFKSRLDPCVVKPVEGNDFEYLILPVRL